VVLDLDRHRVARRADPDSDLTIGGLRCRVDRHPAAIALARPRSSARGERSHIAALEPDRLRPHEHQKVVEQGRDPADLAAGALGERELSNPLNHVVIERVRNCT
jgi:hypothetical protein